MPITDARHYKTLLICPSKTVAAEITPLLSYGLPLAPVYDVTMFPNRRQMVDLLKTSDPVLCFVDMTQNQATGFTVLGDLHALVPEMPVVVLLSANNHDLALQCLRAGATDFLIQPFTTDQVDACVEKLSRILPAPSSRGGSSGKTIAVIPAKGSAGATTLACNLAFQAKRRGAKKILLADLDPIAGCVSFLLKLKSSYSFLDVLHRESNLDLDMWRQMMTTTQGIDVLLAPEALVDPYTDLPTAAPIVEFAQSAYEVVVVDCGNAFGNWNLSIARLSDEILLVTSADLPSLHSVDRVLTYLDHHRVDTSKVKLVVNRHIKDIGLTTQNIASHFGSEILQVVPNDPETVQKSLLDGKALATGSAIGKSLAAMADKLIELQQPEKAGKKAAAKSGLFGSLFK